MAGWTAVAWLVRGYGRGARQATGTPFALRIVGLTVVQGAMSL
jgi:hypothetical protein